MKRKQNTGPIVIGVPEVHGGAAAVPKMDAERHDDSGATERQAAYDFEPVWKGKPLKAFSVSRMNLFTQLRAANGAPKLEVVMDDRQAFTGDAVRILYLCLHDPADWLLHRGDLVAFQMELIDRWADETLHANDLEDALLLGIKVWNQAFRNEAEPVPDATPGRGGDPGN